MITIHNVLMKKNYKTKFSTSLILKKFNKNKKTKKNK